SGETVNFDVTAGPDVGASGSDTTDVDGEAVYSLLNNGTGGTNTIEGSGTYLGLPFSDTVDTTFLDIALTFTPTDGSGTSGGTANIDILLESNGVAVDANGVDFEVTAGPNIGETGSDTTDVTGMATYTYNS